jgi:hypothetical protein
MMGKAGTLWRESSRTTFTRQIIERGKPKVGRVIFN